MPDSPKVYGSPLGAEAHVDAPDRNKVTQATDAQVKAAYQKYMRDVVGAAHKHFNDHVQQQKAAAPSSTYTPQKGGIPRVDKAVQDSGG